MAETFTGAMLRTFAELGAREVGALAVESAASAATAESPWQGKTTGVAAFAAMLEGRMDV